MRVKAGDTVDLIERNLAALRQAFQLCLGQKSVPKLYRAQIVEDHGANLL
jgi:hypothetical protein